MAGVGAALLLMPSAADAVAPPEIVLLAAAVVVQPLVLGTALLSVPFTWLYLHSGAYRLRRFLRPLTSLLGLEGFVALIVVACIGAAGWILSNDRSATAVDLSQLQDQLFSQQPPLLVDLRLPTQFASWHLPGAVNIEDLEIARHHIETHLLSEPQRKIFVYCQTGRTAAWLVDGMIAAVDPSELNRLKDRLGTVKGGHKAMRDAEDVVHLGAIQSITSELAAIWIANGEVQGAALDPTVMFRDPTLSQIRRQAARNGLPVAIVLSGLRPQEIEARLGVSDTWRRFYVEGDHLARVSLPLRMAQAAVTLKRFCGGTGGAMLTLLLLFGAVTIGIHLGTLHFRESPHGSYLRWVEGLMSVLFVLLVREFARSYVDFYGRSVFAGDPTFGMKGSIAVVLIAAGGFARQLANPPPARTRKLVQALQCTYLDVPASPDDRNLRRKIPPWAGAYGLVIALAIFDEIPLPAFLTLGLMMHVPFAVDWCLGRWFAHRLKKARSRESYFLNWVGFRMVRGEVTQWLHTYSPRHPGRFLFVDGSAEIELGLITGELFASPHSSSQLTRDESQRLVRLGRRLWDLLRHDVVAQLDARGRLVGVEVPDGLIDDTRVLHENILSSATGLTTGDAASRRLDSSTLGETLFHPSPLSLDLIRQRWAADGAVHRALASFGLRPRRQVCAGEHLHDLGARVYKDTLAELGLFTRGALVTRLRRARLSVTLQLAAKTTQEDSLTWFEPRAQRRLLRWRESVDQAVYSDRQLHRFVNRCLSQLGGESAQWQEHLAFTHQQLHQKLTDALTRLGLEHEDLRLRDPLATTTSTSSTYELYRAPTPAPADQRITRELAALFQVVEAIEACKQRMRSLHLEELQLSGVLLERLGTRLSLGDGASFLTRAELRPWPNQERQRQLRALIKQRQQRWDCQGHVTLPRRLSVADLEGGDLLGVRQPNRAASGAQPLRGLRVSGLRQPTEGTVCNLGDLESRASDNPLPELAANIVIVSVSVPPHWMVRLRGAGAVICEEGSALCHAAILAREMNLCVVMQVPDAARRLRDGQAVRILPDGTIVEIPAAPPGCIDLRALIDEAVAGAKAFALARMLRAGFHVPPGYVLTNPLLAAATFDANPSNEALHAAVAYAAARLRTADRLIVRSSSTIEDTSEHSHAGLFQSEACDNDVEAIMAAIANCWDSAQRAPMHRYDGSHRPAPFDLSLIIQPYLPSSVGGVLFTQNPLTGNDAEMVLDLSPDGVEAVVQGRKVSSSIISRDGIGALADSTPYLTAPQMESLLAYAVRLEDLFGSPLDIEWIVSAGEIVILQARPLTATPATAPGAT